MRSCSESLFFLRVAVAVADRVVVFRVLDRVSERDRRVFPERVVERLARVDDDVPALEVRVREVSRAEPFPLPVVLPMPFPVDRNAEVVWYWRGG